MSLPSDIINIIIMKLNIPIMQRSMISKNLSTGLAFINAVIIEIIKLINYTIITEINLE